MNQNQTITFTYNFLTLCPAEPDLSFFENIVDPDQLASVEAI